MLIGLLLLTVACDQLEEIHNLEIQRLCRGQIVTVGQVKSSNGRALTKELLPNVHFTKNVTL